MIKLSSNLSKIGDNYEKRLNKKGFTIVELVIVIAVIAVLAAVLIPTFSNVVDNARESALKSDARNLYTEYLTYQSENGLSISEDIYVEIDDLWYPVKSGVIQDLEGITEANIPANAVKWPVETPKIVKKFVKVTEDQADWTGKYLIVYEEESVAFNGSLVGNDIDTENNNFSVVIVDGVIEFSDEISKKTFIIDKIVDQDGKYSIKSASGYYIGQTANDNGLRTNIGIDNLHNYITFEEGLIKIYCKSTVNSDNVLKFNKNSDQKRFRYYKGDGQKPITLYKLTEFVE